MRKLAIGVLVFGTVLSSAPGLLSQGKPVTLFDGATLNGWNGNPAFWSVVDGAIIKSRLVSEANHLGMCFWGDRRPDWRYGECILVIPPNHGMWDYHPGKGSPPRETLEHPTNDPHVWHETEVLAHIKDGTVRVAVNGVEVTRYKDEDPSRLKKGPIGLQIHSGASVVEYKDIEIELDPKVDRLITLKP